VESHGIEKSAWGLEFCVMPTSRVGGVSRSLRRFSRRILWNPLWGEFISIPKEVVGKATTCKGNSRAAITGRYGVLRN
jgi:hypothetical protein